MSAAQILNASTAAAGESAEVKVRAGEIVTFMVTDNLLGAGEDMEIEYKDPSGNWLALSQDGSAVGLSDTNNMAAVYGPGTFHANKSAISAAASGVGLARGNLSL